MAAHDAQELLASLREYGEIPASVSAIIADYAHPFAIYLAGGMTDSPAEADVATVNAWAPENSTFQELPPLPEGRMVPALALAEGILFCIGGSHRDRPQDSAAMLVLSSPQHGWISLPRLSVGREDGQAAVLAGRLYVFSGYNTRLKRGAAPSARAEYLTTDGWKEDAEFGSKLLPLSAFIDGNYTAEFLAVDHKTGRVFLVRADRALIWHADDRRWDEKSLPAPSANACLPLMMRGARMVFLNDALWLLGRAGDDCKTYSGTVLCLDLKRKDTLAWERKAQGPWFQAAACVPYKGRIYSFGGSSIEKCFRECHSYDPANDTWSRLEVSFPEEGRGAVSAASLEQTAPLNSETRAFLTSLLRNGSASAG